ncbi:uncharacterized protein Z519_11028 [Cladophialophora bantiana CBS 173.52]|uniref:Ankyrin n=1 Tax=Cladophialophora bantiana (strain ATCC 10958 / CBS 173.52 / CDC B-1940 / NIH 8579) TaxID=1442370 RepID=A0A0D2HVA9_CLAB1|nr:uncharacterized protein Z519_11028 [Cladophialophora bantiana CBS 173.52]KIW88459.1 hypothetical protein Z519_11028 [Cladophialophora bantiana CBS 173.52]
MEGKVDEILSRLGAPPCERIQSQSRVNMLEIEGKAPQLLLANGNENSFATSSQLHQTSIPQLVALTKGTQAPTLSDPSALRLTPSSRLLVSLTSPFSHAKPSSTKADALPRAAAASNLPKLQHLLASGYPVDHLDSNHGYTALHNASMSGSLTTLALLLSHSASVSTPDVNGATALHHAAQNGHVDASLLLIQNGADVDAVDSAGHAPLFYALQNGHLSVANALLGSGAKMGLVEDRERTHDYWASRLALYFEEGGGDEQNYPRLTVGDNNHRDE